MSGCKWLYPGSLCSGGVCVNNTCICDANWGGATDFIMEEGMDCAVYEPTMVVLYVFVIISGIGIFIAGVIKLRQSYRDPISVAPMVKKSSETLDRRVRSSLGIRLSLYCIIIGMSTTLLGLIRILVP